MKFLVLAALAAVAVADVSELGRYRYNRPASSYGVPYNSVTGSLITPTVPSPGLHVPTYEHQDFKAQVSNQGFVGVSAPAPSVGFQQRIAAPSVNANTGFVGVSAPAPSVGFEQRTSAPSANVNSGFVGVSAPAPSVDFQLRTAAPNVNVNTAAPSLGFNSGSVYSTTAPKVLLPNVGYNFGYTGTSPSLLGTGGVTSVDSNLFSKDAAINSVRLQTTSGGFQDDTFSVSTPVPISSGDAFGTQLTSRFQQSYQNVNSQKTEVSKHLYFYAAPEEPELPTGRINVPLPPPPKKNIKLIFIKAPVPPVPAPIEIAAPLQDQEKTIVYVLVKKPEEQQEIHVQTPPPTEPSKPEVYFIKYKSQKDAEDAISHVQSGVPDTTSHLLADSVGGNEFVSELSKQSTFKTQPIIDYVGSQNSVVPSRSFLTPGSTVGVGVIEERTQVGGQGSVVPSQTLLTPSLTSGIRVVEERAGGVLNRNNVPASTVVTTGAPVTLVPNRNPGVVVTSTPVPHVTYGPPVFKK